ncbi:MAG: SMC family ATPase [Candidatus Aenigmarchaeota archaeon]|nr:SMC family ATPase [Candidatus Aenigmarchaeota archaeon]
MITRVRLRGWKSHLDTDLRFFPGVNALVGIMGAGKSSVMDGLAFGLFGTTPVLQARKLTLEDLIMAGKDRAAVEVGFTVGGKDFLVTREIRRGKSSSAEFRQDGALVEVSPRGVTREVERALGMDYDIFAKAVYAEQNGLDLFLKIPTGQRRQHIDRMLRLDRFEAVRTEAVALEGRVRVGREEKTRIVADLEKDGVEEKAAALGQEIRDLYAVVVQKEGDRSSAAEARQRASQDLAGVEQRQAELDRTVRMLEGLKGGLLEIELREGRNRKVVRGKDIGRMDMEIERMENVVAQKRESLERLMGEIHAAATREKLTADNLAQISGIDGVCPLCENPVAGERKTDLMRRKAAEVTGLGQEKEQKHRVAGVMAEEITTLEKTLAERRLERDRVAQAFQEIRELEAKLQDILRVKREYETAIAGLQKGAQGRDVRGLREVFQEQLVREREIEAELRGLRVRLADKQASLQELARRENMLATYRASLARDGAVAVALEGFGLAVKLTQEDLRTGFLGNVNLILETIWRDLYPYGDFTSVRLGVAEGDYVLQLRAREWIDADTASGGERSLATLALRIAFSLAFLPTLKWLILDEPTHNLDAAAIATFAEILREQMPRFAEQVFLITHDPALSEGLEHVYRLERDKDAGGATRIAQV